ncbi:NADH dehydrogenase [Angomonas deanei]|uniref:Semialdehyde dehydrogenase, NAD binding domain/NAD dependent epimerase/dehydratase family/3-beta hydroxysteroid dehydrogenase/isomerase family, putative n=1 Tax=Angomonas deanei TaxID=59799 RepID=A0A7G2CS75_9TRYP|nr:NADH dehydrogenase [Angomonas deanei]CAD2222219.1 Semialdehyde dehydrogenase, NAD binding domain/NAD dependent epimerase/dehydratase family/3-beta hydroxysteroid dehydrogenase/isomerase family, putative [Angomonas deanei]|eukprot:EPY24549.1 NADH dehydrogenase [Angomonas deanei]
MLSRVSCQSKAAVATVQGARHFFDNNGHQAESVFLDRKDFNQMYPTTKPKTTGGGFGYERGPYWDAMLLPNPAIRLPHERRRLNPKPAKRVTVFGASGYLGAEIVRELCEHPDIEKVRATTRYPTLIPEGSELDLLLNQYPDKIELHECDVTDRIQVNVASNGSDTLIFAVDYHSEYANNSHHDVFLRGATNVSWTARSVRAERVIYCNGLDATFASESNYVDFRARGEDAVGANHPDATIIRFGPLYGKRYRYRGLGRYIYPACFPNTEVQPTWVVDAARAVVRSSMSHRAVRYKFDLGGPEKYRHVDAFRQIARYFDPRIVLPCYRGFGRFFGKLAGWTIPNPWFDENYVLTFELDQVNRRSTLFDRLASWERLEYTPHTIAQAAAIEAGEEPLQPLHELDVAFRASEEAEKAAFKEEEESAKKFGIYRAVAEPGFGRTDGLEALAQEIYPGQQFRNKPLEGAKYPKTVKNPGPTAIQ